MNREEFIHALTLGLGSAVLFLRENENNQEFIDIIYDFCVHNYTFDPQCEGSRVHYLWDLICATGRIPELQLRIINTLSDNDYHIDHYQIYQLGLIFINQGDFNCLNTLMENFRYHETKDGFVGEDEIVKLLGEEGILFVSQQICNRLNEDNAYEGEYFFIRGLKDNYDVDKLRNILKPIMEYSERFTAYVNKSLSENSYNPRKRERESYNSIKSKLKDSHYGIIRVWARKASYNELKLVEEDIKNSDDYELITKLMHAFHKHKYTQDITRIIKFLDEEAYNLSESSVEILKWFSDIRIRKKGLKLIQTKDNWFEYIPLFCNNFRDEDYELMLELCHREYDKFEWHSIQLGLNELFEIHTNVNCHQLYTKLYYSNPCSICREEMLKYMLRDGFSEREILNHLKWDSNIKIRTMVADRY